MEINNELIPHILKTEGKLTIYLRAELRWFAVQRTFSRTPPATLTCYSSMTACVAGRRTVPPLSFTQVRNNPLYPVS